MSPAENAFNALYPAVLRVVAIHRRLTELHVKKHFDQMDDLGPELVTALDELERQTDAIEAGTIDATLSTSIAGVLNQLRRQAGMN